MMDDTLEAAKWHNSGCCTRLREETVTALLRVLWDVRLCQNERLPGNGDDTLIRTAGCARRQLARDFGRDISSNDGEVAVFKLENIWAAMQAWGLHTVQMRVGTDSA